MASSTSSAAAGEPKPCSTSTGASSNSSENVGRAVWFIATFASNHMTGNQSLISDLVPLSNQFVKVGTGEAMQVCGKGSVNTETVVLPDVWYVPGLATNLVSVGQLADDPNLVINMGGGACRIDKISDGSVIGRAHLRSDKKYEVDFLKIQLN